MPQLESFSAATAEAARILGGRIRLARRARGWTIAELAGRVGVTQKTIHKVESGDPTVRLGVAFEAAVLTAERRELQSLETVLGRQNTR